MKVNGISIDDTAWGTPQMAAVHELLRQRALALELITDDADDDQVNDAIETVLADEVRVPEPTTAECRRWYEANLSKYRSGELVHARHILFQITQGTPVLAVRSVADAMLMEVRANPDVFEERARDKSNCPSGAQGGQLGQLQRGSTVPEFEKEVFAGDTIGVLPKLIQTRHGFHIVSVDQRIAGEQLPFAAVAEQIADELRRISEERALTQYIRMLAGSVEIEGVDLDAATSPLVQ
ncbi:MAG TPA: peptidylprolyl isomerase [Salinisphaeraceae bacterium]|nr:peptidylprolyl isomerase [Salinisphaeraceae bacterium]